MAKEIVRQGDVLIMQNQESLKGVKTQKQVFIRGKVSKKITTLW